MKGAICPPSPISTAEANHIMPSPMAKLISMKNKFFGMCSFVVGGKWIVKNFFPKKYLSQSQVILN